ncbi:MAG: hypothetical protein JWO67_6721 [Streptosporangiaceae bacterium]|nr:hypothetical protein [Streptosporangiaceae bacterium]
MGSILADQISQLMQGGQIVLQCLFETFVGSGQQAEAGGVTISITAATDELGQPVPTAGEGTPVQVTSQGVSTVDSSLYTFTYAAAADQAPGDYLVTWAGQVAGVQQTWQQTITVTLMPTGSPAPGVYATMAQYRDEREDHATPDWLVRKNLRLASRIIRHATIGAVYDHTPNGMPAQGVTAQAFMEACCAQVEFLIDDNDPTGVKRQYTSTSMGGVNLTRAPQTAALVFPPLAPEAAMILHNYGVLGVAVLVDW